MFPDLVVVHFVVPVFGGREKAVYGSQSFRNMFLWGSKYHKYLLRSWFWTQTNLLRRYLEPCFFNIFGVLLHSKTFSLHGSSCSL